MVRKKGNKKGRNDTDSDSDFDDGVAQKGTSKPTAEKIGVGGLSRKQKRMEKLAGKSKGGKPLVSDPYDQVENEDAEDHSVDDEKSREGQAKAQKDQASSSDENRVEDGKRRQRKVIGKAKTNRNNKNLVEYVIDEDQLGKESENFQMVIPDDSDENKGNARMNKKKSKKEKLDEKIDSYEQIRQGKQSSNAKVQKNYGLLESEDEDEVVEKNDESQLPLRDDSVEQFDSRKKKKKGKTEKNADDVEQGKNRKQIKPSRKSNDQTVTKAISEADDGSVNLILDDSDEAGFNQKKKQKEKKKKKKGLIGKDAEIPPGGDLTLDAENSDYQSDKDTAFGNPILDISGCSMKDDKKRTKQAGRENISDSKEKTLSEEDMAPKDLLKSDEEDGKILMDMRGKKKKGKKSKDHSKHESKHEEDIDEMNRKEELEEKKLKDSEDEEDIMYGAPDDKVWTDKSFAQVESEKRGAVVDNDLSKLAPDGKKLSNKERKRLKKEIEAKERMEEAEKAAAKASKEGAQFACSQTAVDTNDPQWCNSLDINIPSFNISAAGKVLFKDATLNIPAGRRVGFVAPNGRGKSTLLKMIASKELLLPPKIDFLYVEQEVTADDTPAVEAVLMADKKRWSLLEEENSLTQAIDSGNENPELLLRLQQVLEELSVIGSDAAEAKARRILYGLGFDGDMQTKATKLFSGGWRMRISLARALFMEPTLLMLIWLDDYLQRWKKTLLIVSHDQDFLNSVCEEIMHIEDQKIVNYKGNYDTFKQMEKTKMQQQQKEWEKQEKMLRSLKKSGQSRAKATETVTKSAREPGARAFKKKQDAAIATGTSSVVAKELIKRPREYVVKLEFAEVPEIARPVIEVHNVHFRYSLKHPVIFDKVDFGIDLDSRVCIVGPNGAGKSTLLKLLIGELNPTSGEVRRNPRLRMGVYQQHFVDRLPMDKTAVQHLRDRFQDQDYQSIRNRLGKYGLEGHAHEVSMRDLSGGQKARVVFVELSLQRPHVLLLDEPTNNLDIETIDALIDAINDFNGGIVVVTHDARLIEQCNCSLWVVEKQGVTQWQDGFDDYKTTILREMEEKMSREAEARRAKLEAAATARSEKLTEKLRRLTLSKK